MVWYHAGNIPRDRWAWRPPLPLHLHIKPHAHICLDKPDTPVPMALTVCTETHDCKNCRKSLRYAITGNIKTDNADAVISTIHDMWENQASQGQCHWSVIDSNWLTSHIFEDILYGFALGKEPIKYMYRYVYPVWQLKFQFISIHLYPWRDKVQWSAVTMVKCWINIQINGQPLACPYSQQISVCHCDNWQVFSIQSFSYCCSRCMFT